MGIAVSMPAEIGRRLLAHLGTRPTEQLAFMLCRWEGESARVFDIRPIVAGGFDLQTPWHLSLSDDERAAVIRWAHQASASLIEAHSHLLPGPAELSPSDLGGLDAFVPHVWWRLAHRPYAALVFSEDSFDGLAWRVGPKSPEPIARLNLEGSAGWGSTGRTYRRLSQWK